ncbi:MAG TPA: TIGR00730 family Rossman fold protein [Rhizomicrobium sp.]|jgi:hypothetical protein|nr:TIGR00730 family Rossman fold protein [Rhizomicrobium sp.]
MTRPAKPAKRRRAHKIPPPPHPLVRRRPLPEQLPKPAAEDAEAPEALRAILASPTYRQADHDIDFLARGDTRDIRLALDYEKAELVLRERGIAHTIVVFGSTRICEPAAARKHVAELTKAVDLAPHDKNACQRLEIAKRILAKSRYYDIAREFGRIVSEAGAKRRRNRTLIVTGGGPGIMEAANRGASDAGASSVGLNITLPHEQFPNPYVTPELCFRFHYFAIRKLHFLLRARALVAFPGGYGTMDELFEVLTLGQTRKISPVPVILVGESYWRKVFDPDFLVAEGTIDPEDRELFWFADSAEEIWRGIVDWYEAAGRPLLGREETR